MNSSAILDIAILAVLVLFALLGAKKGFFRMLADAFMVLLASIGARIISNAFAAQVAAKLAPLVQEQVLRRLEAALGDTLGQLAHMGEAVIAPVIAQAAEELTFAMARSLLFMAAFAVLLAVLKIFVGTTNVLLHLPVLRQCNELLGAVVGLAVGCLLAVIVTRICLTFGWYITDEMASGSILMGIFNKGLQGLPITLPNI